MVPSVSRQWNFLDIVPASQREREREKDGNQLNPYNGCMLQSFRSASREFLPSYSFFSTFPPPPHFHPFFSYPIYCSPPSTVKALSASDTKKKLTGTGRIRQRPHKTCDKMERTLKDFHFTTCHDKNSVFIRLSVSGYAQGTSISGD
jgi:hypothetical protein